MYDILKATAVMGALGLGFGVIIAVASVWFRVKADGRIEMLRNALPGANCGACGHAGCRAFAQALIEDKSTLDECPVAKDEVKNKVSEIMK